MTKPHRVDELGEHRALVVVQEDVVGRLDVDVMKLPPGNGSADLSLEVTGWGTARQRREWGNATPAAIGPDAAKFFCFF